MIMKTVNEKFKTLMSDCFLNHVNDTLLVDDSESKQLAKKAEDLSKKAYSIPNLPFNDRNRISL